MMNIQPRLEAFFKNFFNDCTQGHNDCSPAHHVNINVKSNWREIPGLEDAIVTSRSRSLRTNRRAWWILVGRFDPVTHAVLVRKQNGCISTRINGTSPPPESWSYFLPSFTPTLSIYLKLETISQASTWWFNSHVAMLISPIQLTELISFCDSGVLAFDVFVNGVLVMFQMLTKMCVCGGEGTCLFLVPTACWIFRLPIALHCNQKQYGIKSNSCYDCSAIKRWRFRSNMC